MLSSIFTRLGNFINDRKYVAQKQKSERMRTSLRSSDTKNTDDVKQTNKTKSIEEKERRKFTNDG